MSKHDRRGDRHSLRAGDVRQQFERHLESLRLRGVSFDEAMESLTAMVVTVLAEQDSIRLDAAAVEPSTPAQRDGSLLADLRQIPHRMSVTAAASLHLIRCRPHPTPTDLSHDLGVSAAAMTGTLDKLVSLGLVIRREDPADRRRVILQLTDSGSRLAGRIFPA